MTTALTSRWITGRRRPMKIWAAVAVAIGIALIGRAQTPAQLTDLGLTAPTKGTNDIAQLSTAGSTTSPDHLYYYTDSQTDHGGGEPGQTFTTQTNAVGYILTSLSLKSHGSGFGSSSTDNATNYLLHIYSVSASNATLLATYINVAPTKYTSGDWLKWSGLSVKLAPATAYAYSFGKAAAGSIRGALSVAVGSPYSGGEIALIPTTGGSLSFGSSRQYDATFDIGLSLAKPPTLPVVTNLPATDITTNGATLNAQIVTNGGSQPTIVLLHYGTNDAGTNTHLWQQNIALAASASAFALPVTGLSTNTTYFYTLSASNSAGTAWAAPSRSFTTLSPPPPPPPAPVLPAMVTYHNNNARDGANTNETILTPANVNTNSFDRLFSYPVDGHVYAQPLVVPNVSIPGKGVHNVVYVATEHDTLYALDADSNAGADGGLLWSTNLGLSAAVPNNDFGYRYGPFTAIMPEMGITGTPVIDPVSGTLFVDVFTHDGINIYNHRIHALDITTGAERPCSPVLVSASVPGSGYDSSNGVVAFNPGQHLQRSALTLAGGRLYVPYASYGDTDPYHGWIVGFDAGTLQPLTNQVFNTTPNGAEGGLWMAGNGLAVDDATNLYFMTGNGSFTQNTNGGDYGDSFVRLSTSNGLTVADYFTPYNQLDLQLVDGDLGSGGSLLLPDSAGSAAHPHLIVGAGKEGKIILVDRDNMGHYNPLNDAQVVQELPGAVGGIFSSPACFNHLIFFQGVGDVMKAFAITNAGIAPTPVSQSSVSSGFPGDTPTVSANGTSNAIVWSIQSDAFGTAGPAILHAYNATNLSEELYNSSQDLDRDNPGPAVKMTVPTIVHGKVYVGAEYNLSVFGNELFTATPLITPAGGYFTNSATVTLTDNVPGVSLYYTLDGSTPTTSSIPYAGPFVVTNTTVVSAVATASETVNSGTATANFINGVVTGTGVGLTGAYYTNQSDQPFAGVPSLVRTDATVNFNWDGNPPDPQVGTNVFTVRWTGSVEPQFDETYTFSVTADDGLRLWVNGQQLIDGWGGQSPRNYQGSITLAALQLYNITLEYYAADSNAAVQLAWSSPSTPAKVIPQTQLYPFTNPPPTVVITSPTNDANYAGAVASVTISANADTPYNSLTGVDFYIDGAWQGTLDDAPYSLTASGLTNGTYALTVVARDGSGLSTTTAPVNITVSGGSTRPFGLGKRAMAQPFLNLPGTFNGPLPKLLSQTGVFSNTAAMTPAIALIPYLPNVSLWSDGAVKTRYLAVPSDGGAITPAEQITFAPTGSWTFPAGTVFVKTFELQTNDTDPDSLLRLETRLLVRDINGQVYGITYKWRADESDADLLTTRLQQDIPIVTATGMRTQSWYYPSPADCLTCHTPAAGYVLGVNTRQLNHRLTYPGSGVTDNQLRTLNQLGIFNPAFDESIITNFERLSALTNQTASLTDRVRSYLDANCAQCHLPGGTGPTFDARYDTPLAAQNITNFPANWSLGYDRACIVKPQDLLRSTLYDRINTVDTPAARQQIQMPPFAHSLIDTDAVSVVEAWINSLPGIPALAPPVITPDGGIFAPTVTVSLQAPDTNASIYYTLDGSLPTTNSLLYSAPFTLTNSAIVTANAFETDFDSSVAANAFFELPPPLRFVASAFLTNNVVQFEFSGVPGSVYVLQATTNFTDWTPLSTNLAPTNLFDLYDSTATNFPYRYYRVLAQ